MSENILEVKNLKMHFPSSGGFLKPDKVVKAVDGISLTLKKGEILGLVGESGCGKSTLGRSIIRLYEPNSGTVILDGHDITHMSSKELRPHRPKIQMIFQDPYASLSPRMTVFDIIAEPLRTHNICKPSELTDKVLELLDRVGLPRRFLRKYPHEFSGGQRQRIAIARAIAPGPKVIIADEPVSALDVSIQAQILALIEELRTDLGIAFVFIAHDLAAVKHIADRIAVMYLGKMAEIHDADTLFETAAHPYTISLLSAIPLPDPRSERNRKRILLTGDLPNPANPPKGCSFHTRCPVATKECGEIDPELVSTSQEGGHKVRCTRAGKILSGELKID